MYWVTLVLISQEWPGSTEWQMLCVSPTLSARGRRSLSQTAKERSIYEDYRNIVYMSNPFKWCASLRERFAVNRKTSLNTNQISCFCIFRLYINYILKEIISCHDQITLTNEFILIKDAFLFDYSMPWYMKM